MRKNSVCKIIAGIGCLLLLSMEVTACGAGMETEVSVPEEEISMDDSDMTQLWETAVSTPLGKYPELVEYTLGKPVMEKNSNMPDGNTYEDNNYTRYLREQLNVQNIDVLEAEDGIQYEQMEWISVMEGDIPDIMVVTSKELLDYLVEQDLIEDLTSVYENCTTDRIREMYDSYGEDLLGSVTYDGRLMAFPETQVYSGPVLIWLRKDWITALKLEEPTNLEEAMEIVRQFHEMNPGNNPDGNIGLALDPVLVEKTDQCFSATPVMDTFQAYPGKWFPDENGTVVYGSVQPEMKAALGYLHQLYENKVIDPDFMLRNGRNLPELLETGRCGAFFGWWWAPNDPLYAIYDGMAKWKPYVFAEENSYSTSLPYGVERYVVVRKGYEHPEIVPKILSVLYDYARYEGKEDAAGVRNFLGANVHASATPLDINLDYSDATFRVTRQMQEVQKGNMEYEDLTVLEQGYWNSSQRYLQSAVPSATVWAAYTSRMDAVAQLAQIDVTYRNKGYTQNYAGLHTAELQELEEKAFIMIITGEKPLDYFDTFVEEWYEQGGTELVEEANR